MIIDLVDIVYVLRFWIKSYLDQCIRTRLKNNEQNTQWAICFLKNQIFSNLQKESLIG